MTALNPSPKARFQADKKLIEQHNRLIERSDLQTSIDYALLEYQAQLTGIAAGGNEAAAAHFRLMGAHEFINIFKRLSEQHQEPIIQTLDNLNHRA